MTAQSTAAYTVDMLDYIEGVLDADEGFQAETRRYSNIHTEDVTSQVAAEVTEDAGNGLLAIKAGITDEIICIYGRREAARIAAQRASDRAADMDKWIAELSA